MEYQQTPTGNVNNYLVPAILVTLFCCLPFGVVAIIFAAQVNGKLSAGDYAGAVDASNKARTFTWVAFGLGLITQLAYIGFMVLAGVAGAAGQGGGM